MVGLNFNPKTQGFDVKKTNRIILTKTHQVGPEGIKQLMNMGFKALHDWHENIEDIITEGDRVWVLLTYTGTQIGESHGLAPTGKKITAMAVDIYRIVNGKLVEYWNVTDSLDFSKQLVLSNTQKKERNSFQKM